MAQVVNVPAVQETRIQSLGWEDFLEKGMAPHSSILPGESHGQRNFVGCSPFDCTQSDMIERLTLQCHLGSPLYIYMLIMFPKLHIYMKFKLIWA